MPILVIGIVAMPWLWPARRGGKPPGSRRGGRRAAATARQVPETLNFANGLFRDRRTEWRPRSTSGS